MPLQLYPEGHFFVPLAREREGLCQLEGILNGLPADYGIPVMAFLLKYVVRPHSYGTKSVMQLGGGSEGNAPVYGIKLVLSPFLRL